MPLVDTTKPDVEDIALEAMSREPHMLKLYAQMDSQRVAFCDVYVRTADARQAARAAYGLDEEKDGARISRLVPYLMSQSVIKQVIGRLLSSVHASPEALKTRLLQFADHAETEKHRLHATTELLKLAGEYAKHEMASAPAVLVQVNTPARGLEVSRVIDVETKSQEASN